jgi:cytoskeletal protein CcmA (bactofilin family)
MGKMKNDKGEKGLNTIIGKGARLEGQIEVNGGIRIDGEVKGKVTCTDTLSIGSEGVVEADLEAKHAVIGGKVKGNILASEKLELQSTSVVVGEVTSKSLAVEEGSLFHGKCNMREETEPPG